MRGNKMCTKQDKSRKDLLPRQWVKKDKYLREVVQQQQNQQQQKYYNNTKRKQRSRQYNTLQKARKVRTTMPMLIAATQGQQQNYR